MFHKIIPCLVSLLLAFPIVANANIDYQKINEYKSLKSQYRKLGFYPNTGSREEQDSKRAAEILRQAFKNNLIGMPSSEVYLNSTLSDDPIGGSCYDGISYQLYANFEMQVYVTNLNLLRSSNAPKDLSKLTTDDNMDCSNANTDFARKIIMPKSNFFDEVHASAIAQTQDMPSKKPTAISVVLRKGEMVYRLGTALNTNQKGFEKNKTIRDNWKAIALQMVEEAEKGIKINY